MVEQVELWVGVDWGSRENQVCILHGSGQRVAKVVVGHDGESLNALAAIAEQERNVSLGSARRSIQCMLTPYTSDVRALAAEPNTLRNCSRGSRDREAKQPDVMQAGDGVTLCASTPADRAYGARGVTCLGVRSATRPGVEDRAPLAVSNGARRSRRPGLKDRGPRSR